MEKRTRRNEVEEKELFQRFLIFFLRQIPFHSLPVSLMIVLETNYSYVFDGKTTNINTGFRQFFELFEVMYTLKLILFFLEHENETADTVKSMDVSDSSIQEVSSILDLPAVDVYFLTPTDLEPHKEPSESPNNQNIICLSTSFQPKNFKFPKKA